MTTKKYTEQWERVKRQLQRFEALERGIDHTQHSEHYSDDVHSFFQNCYHLKDWIKNDPYCSGWQDVEKLINGDVHLQLCADLCNAQKHLTLTQRPRSDQNPQFGGGKTHLTITEGGPATIQIAVSYTISTKHLGDIDALILARQCVDSWTVFISINDP